MMSSALWIRAARLGALLVVAGLAATPLWAADTAAPTANETYAGWVIRSSGLIGAFILLLSIYFVATIIRLFFDLKLSLAAPPALVEQCELLVQHRDLRGAHRMLKDNDSFLARVLRAALPALPHGLPEAREALDRATETETVALEQRISILAVIGTLGPMIGLLGTLKGMIASFSVIAMSDVQMKASEVAGGISEALLLTFEGVALSVPAIYFFSFFRNRVQNISAQTAATAESLLRKFYVASRSKPEKAPAPAGAAAASGETP